MMDKGGDMGGSGANNSSDFVRKLYKMLEDPSYDRIVRWGENGESFVVLENEKFTNNILPKHFKHSNFASFVRQLNKYDFHKVRHSNEDSTPSPYGPNAWEFKHPEFQANKKDSLDNIRRKAPAPRKTTQSIDDSYPGQQMDLVNSQLVATQQQLQQLSERYQDLAQGHVVLLQQVVQLQKIVKNHDGVMHRVMSFLYTADAQRRNSRVAGGPFGTPMGEGGEHMPEMDVGPPSPLQQASELLDQYNAENLPNKELEQMTHDYHLRNEYSTPPNDHSVSSAAPQANSNTLPTIGYSVSNDLDNDNMVYPVGHTNGIDPINSEHIHNIPYALPTNGMLPPEAMPEMLPAGGGVAGRKKSAIESVWGLIKPRILLVEDDKVCARIGSKFLHAFECGVDTASDGLEAVHKCNNLGAQYDLILMDIIMPHLDGVSATSYIREVRPQIPIIAMTSNIRTDDIDMYFRYGMNDVLPKPFTKEGMLRALEKHLPHFKKNAPFPPAAGQMSHPGFITPSATQPALGISMGQLSATQSLKEEPSPSKSPTTATSWHSPSQLPGASPIGNSQSVFMQQSLGDSRPYGMTPTHATAPLGFSTPPNSALGSHRAQRRVMSDMAGGPDEQPEKRQRIYPGAPGPFPH